MRTTKAYIASFGTSGVLLLGAALLLAGMSTFVAFTAWPDGGIRGPIERVFGGQSGAPAVSGPEQIAADAGPAASDVAGEPVAGTLAARADARDSVRDRLARVRQEQAASGPRGVIPPPAQDTPGTSGGGGIDGGSGGGGGTSGGARPAPGVTDILPIGPGPSPGPASVPEAARGLTAGLGESVAVVSPGLGTGVTNVGDGLANLVAALPDLELLGIRILGDGR